MPLPQVITAISAGLGVAYAAYEARDCFYAIWGEIHIALYSAFYMIDDLKDGLKTTRNVHAHIHLAVPPFLDTTSDEDAVAKKLSSARRADDVSRMSRFCLSCNPVLASYVENARLSHATAGYVCTALVPVVCDACRETVATCFLPCEFRLTDAQHLAFTGMRQAKLDNARKSINNAVLVISEGRDVKDFTPQGQIGIEFFGLINALQATRLIADHDRPGSGRFPWWRSNSYKLEWWLSLSAHYRSHVRHKQDIIDCSASHRLTGRHYASEWRQVIPRDNHVSVSDVAKELAIVAVVPTRGPVIPPVQAPALQPPPPAPVVPPGVPPPEVPPAIPPPDDPPSDDDSPGDAEEEASIVVIEETPGYGIACSEAQLEMLARIYAAAEAQEVIVGEEGGRLPVRRVTALTARDYSRIYDELEAEGTLPPLRPLHERYDLRPCAGILWREDITVVFKDHIIKVAPLLSAAVVYDGKDAITVAASGADRCLADGQWWLDSPPEEQDPSLADDGMTPEAVEKMRKDLKRKMHAFFSTAKRTVFHRKHVNAFVARMPLVEDMKNGKLSVEKFIEHIDNMRYAVKLPMLTAKQKEEITAKPLKSGRIVIDCGLERTVVETVVAFVFDHMLFAHCKHISIKGQSRDVILNQISREYAAEIKGLRDAVMEELDQAMFDGHNRVYGEGKEKTGLFKELLALYHHVAVAIGESSNSCWNTFEVCVGAQDTAGRAYLKFRLDGAGSWVALLRELYMLSGRKITSSGNFVCELFLSLATAVDHPEEIWMHDLSTFDFMWKVKAAGPGMFYYRFRLEGDDQLGRKDGRLCTVERKAYARRAFIEMGFSAKLVYASGRNGAERAEFVGVHFVVINGATLPDLWVPAISRGLVSSGGYIADVNGGALDRQGHVALSLMSRAVGFAGKCEPAASYLRCMAEKHQDSWLSLLDTVKAVKGKKGKAAQREAADQRVVLEGYHSEARGLEGKGFNALCAEFDVRTADAHSTANQMLLLETSVQASVELAEYANWLGHSTGFDPESPAQDVLASMPLALVTAFGKTLV